MKKTLITLTLVGALISGYNVYKSQNEKDFSTAALANVEALAEEETGSSSNWDCWSQEKKGDGYWRCGNPCKWIDGHGGKGDASKCYS